MSYVLKSHFTTYQKENHYNCSDALGANKQVSDIVQQSVTALFISFVPLSSKYFVNCFDKEKGVLFYIMKFHYSKEWIICLSCVHAQLTE